MCRLVCEILHVHICMHIYPHPPTHPPTNTHTHTQEQAALVDEVGELAARLTAFYFEHNTAMLKTVGEVSMCSDICLVMICVSFNDMCSLMTASAHASARTHTHTHSLTLAFSHTHR